MIKNIPNIKFIPEDTKTLLETKDIEKLETLKEFVKNNTSLYTNHFLTLIYCYNFNNSSDPS